MYHSNWKTLIEETNFHHVFQPIFHLKTNKIFGYEALLRSDGFDNPDLIFKYAKEQNELFDFDIMSVFKIFAWYENKFVELGDGNLFINIFPMTLKDKAFYYSIERAVSALSFDPNSIVFEINDFDNELKVEEVKEMIVKLRDLGFQVALTFTEINEPNIITMKELKPDVLKFDRAIGADLVDNAEKQKFVKQVLTEFGGSTPLIIEGLEKDDDIKAVKELEIDYGQGFILGKPQKI